MKIEQFLSLQVKGPHNIISHNYSRLHCLITLAQIAEGKKLIEPCRGFYWERRWSNFFCFHHFIVVVVIVVRVDPTRGAIAIANTIIFSSRSSKLFDSLRYTMVTWGCSHPSWWWRRKEEQGDGVVCFWFMREVEMWMCVCVFVLLAAGMSGRRFSFDPVESIGSWKSTLKETRNKLFLHD